MIQCSNNWIPLRPSLEGDAHICRDSDQRRPPSAKLRLERGPFPSSEFTRPLPFNPLGSKAPSRRLCRRLDSLGSEG